jgi:DNA polymerase-3 subunit alpha
MGKKIPKEMAAQREKFIQGCLSHGKLPGEKAEELWKLIEPFAAYGFNKAHAASYGIVAYQTAYLKAHYPAEYMTAVLTAESGNLDTVAEIVAECRRMGIAVLPPSLSESAENFTRLDDRHIRFGLLAIKNVGSDVAQAVIAERTRGGPFRSLEDFLERVPAKNFNKKFLEALVKAGALDEWGDRQQLLTNVEALLKYHRTVATGNAGGQVGLFGDWRPRETLHLEPADPTTKDQRLTWERELLGLYLTEHPLQQFQAELEGFVTALAHLPHYQTDDLVAVNGLVESVRRITTKNGEPMAFAKLSDLTASAEVVVFPGTLRSTAQAWESNQPLLVAGKVSRRDGEVKLLCEGAEVLRPGAAKLLRQRWAKIRFVRRDVSLDVAEPAEV